MTNMRIVFLLPTRCYFGSIEAQWFAEAVKSVQPLEITDRAMPLMFEEVAFSSIRAIRVRVNPNSPNSPNPNHNSPYSPNHITIVTLLIMN